MSPRDSLSSEQAAQLLSLAERLRDGDSIATLQVRQRVRRILVFGRLRIPAEDRADLEQVIMLQLWQAVSRPSFDSEGLWGFVEVLVARRCIDWLRARKPEAPLELGGETIDAAANPLQDALRRERAGLARVALSRLPAPCQELIRLHAGLGKSYREIAAIVDRSEGALRVQLHRCIRRASKILAELTEPGRPE